MNPKRRETVKIRLAAIRSIHLSMGPARPNGKPSEDSFSYGWNQEEMGDEGQTQNPSPPKC